MGRVSFVLFGGRMVGESVYGRLFISYPTVWTDCYIKLIVFVG